MPIRLLYTILHCLATIHNAADSRAIGICRPCYSYSIGGLKTMPDVGTDSTTVKTQWTNSIQASCNVCVYTDQRHDQLWNYENVNERHASMLENGFSKSFACEGRSIVSRIRHYLVQMFGRFSTVAELAGVQYNWVTNLKVERLLYK